MKIRITTLAVISLLSFSSCMKDYTCVCTNSNTGDKKYGDKFKAGPIRKPAAEKTCENTGVLSLGELKDCHLE